jgi:hypothetical protein
MPDILFDLALKALFGKKIERRPGNDDILSTGNGDGK